MSQSRSHSSEKTPHFPWFILFFDLIVVASVSKVSKIYGADPTWQNFSYVAVCVLFLFALWGLTSFELLLRDSWLRRILALIQVVALLVAALSLGDKSSLDALWGFAAVSVAVGVAAVLVGLRAIGKGAEWRRTANVAIWLGVSSVIYLAAALVPRESSIGGMATAQWFLLAGTAVLVAVAAVQAPHLLVGDQKLDQQVVQERLGLILIIVLGESFLMLLSSVGANGTVAQPVFLLATIVAVVSIWLLYFPSLAHAPFPTTRRGIRARMTAHYLLILGSVDAIVASASIAKDSVDYGAAGGIVDSWTALPLVGVVVAILWITCLRDGRWSAAATRHLVTILLVAILSIIGMLVTYTVANGLLLAAIGVVFLDGVLGVSLRLRR